MYTNYRRQQQVNWPDKVVLKEADVNISTKTWADTLFFFTQVYKCRNKTAGPIDRNMEEFEEMDNSFEDFTPKKRG